MAQIEDKLRKARSRELVEACKSETVDTSISPEGATSTRPRSGFTEIENGFGGGMCAFPNLVIASP